MGSGWLSVSQVYCEPEDVRKLIHSVAHDEFTRVQATGTLVPSLPVYNFVPPGVMSKISD